ncbi:membrane metalloprotease [Pseudofulvibacter geojedonensis]|uniref:Membrane metalloprotease n=1 Tax=Pseudofulvibacter geojedonensis TaxID=1123758 RepID=A0ABW3I0F1_9FLAO
MKNKILYLIALILVISCSKDESTNNNDSQGGANNTYPYKQSVGYSANDILSGNNFQEIEIDLMYINGFRPEQNSINNVIEFIEERTFKTTVTITPRLIEDTNINSYTIDNIKNLEDSNRTLFTQDNKITISALFVNGSSSSNNGNNVVLGTAYRNTSFVIYQETIQGLSNSPLETNRVTLETSVILHELCHLLGLVNVGTNMVENHQDAAHGAHCNVNSCLMYYALENGNTISNTISGNQVPQLDSFCLQDLQANGGR